jgi:hypothetical protein
VQGAYYLGDVPLPEDGGRVLFADAPAGWGELGFPEFDEFGGRLHYQVVSNVPGRQDAGRVWMTRYDKFFAAQGFSQSIVDRHALLGKSLAVTLPSIPGVPVDLARKTGAVTVLFAWAPDGGQAMLQSLKPWRSSLTPGEQLVYLALGGTAEEIATLQSAAPIKGASAEAKAVLGGLPLGVPNLYSMDYELNMELVTSKKYLFFPINITSVFNQNIGSNQSSANSLKQRLETVFVQLKYAKNLKEKLHVLWRAKKLLLKNSSSLNQLNSL